MAERRRRAPQWTLATLIAIVVAAAVLACILFPSLARAKRESNEREASAMMRMLATAEADFRSNDRDNDRAQNFWVRDVSGLFRLCPSTNGSSVPAADPDHMLRLIEPSLAAADVTDVGADVPGMVSAVEAFRGWQPRSGYVFRALATYAAGPWRPSPIGGDGGPLPSEVSPTGAPVRYAVVGGIEAWGEAFNFGKFGFTALPKDRDAGSQAFLMDENITIYRLPIDADYEATYEPAGPRARFTWRGVSVLGRPFTPASPYPAEP